MIATSESSPVAVIMTLYRKDRLDMFEKAISSVEMQTIPNKIRIYLCVDGPLPSTHEDYLAPNITRFHKIIRNNTNKGLASSLNSLIDILEDEEFVFRMDSDDICHPTRFLTQIAHMREHPELGLIGCQALDINDQDEVVGERRYPEDSKAVLDALLKVNPVLHPTYCIRRDILRNANARYPEAYLTEDLAFLIRLVKLGTLLGNSSQILFSWRVGSDFFKRRQSFRRGLVELKLYSSVVYMQKGIFSLFYAYPVARFVLRLLPQYLIRLAYRGDVREQSTRISSKNVGSQQ